MSPGMLYALPSVTQSIFVPFTEKLTVWPLALTFSGLFQLNYRLHVYYIIIHICLIISIEHSLRFGHVTCRNKLCFTPGYRRTVRCPIILPPGYSPTSPAKGVKSTDGKKVKQYRKPKSPIVGPTPANY